MSVCSSSGLVARLCSGRWASSPGVLRPSVSSPPVRYRATPPTTTTTRMMRVSRMAMPPDMALTLPARVGAKPGRSPPMSLEGKVVAVTGASARVGRATGRGLGRRGGGGGVIARGGGRVHAAAQEVRAEGRRACVAPADVADAAQVEAAAERIEAELGPIDVWINVAMSAVLAEITETTPEEFKRVTEVTYLGSVHGVQAALR